MGPLNRDPMDSEKQLRVYKSPVHTRRNRNTCLKVLRLSMGKICACVYTASDANWLMYAFQFYFIEYLYSLVKELTNNELCKYFNRCVCSL